MCVRWVDCRCKADLQEVVISADYAKQDWKKHKSNKDTEANDDDEDDDCAGEGGTSNSVSWTTKAFGRSWCKF